MCGFISGLWILYLIKTVISVSLFFKGFISGLWILYLVKTAISVSLFFKGFILLFQLTVVPLLSSFCLTFPLWLLVKWLLIAVLKVCSYVGVSLYRLHVLKAFGGELHLMWMQISIFTQGVLTAITFIAGGLEMEELELASAVRWDYPLLISHHHPTGENVWSQVAGTEALSVWPKQALFILSVCFSSLRTGTPAPEGRLSVARGAYKGFWLLLAADRDPSCPQCTTSQSLCSL